MAAPYWRLYRNRDCQSSSKLRSMPVIAWPVAGGPVSLSPGAVHVWGWSLNVAPGKVFPGNESALSAEERARADRFVSPIHRARFVASHSGLRQVLSGYLRVKP